MHCHRFLFLFFLIHNNSGTVSSTNAQYVTANNGVIVSTAINSEYDANIFNLKSVAPTEGTFGILCEKGKASKIAFPVLPN